MAKATQEPELPFIGAYIFGKKRDKTAYLHRPPTISPNYGKPLRNPLPRSYVARVILFENSLQQNLLDAEIKEYNRKIRRRKGEFYKKKFTFIDDRKRRQKGHELWEVGYQRLKSAYIEKYGTKYMPIPTPEPEVNPFFFYARLVPPLNVVYFYLDAINSELEEPETQISRQSKVRHRHPTNATSEYLHDHERLIGCENKLMYSHSVEDPRFRSLESALIKPSFKCEGYLQLSPGYHGRDKVRVKKWSLLRHRAITLPRFYSKPPPIPEVTEEQSSKNVPKAPEKDATFPLMTSTARSRRLRIRTDSS